MSVRLAGPHTPHVPTPPFHLRLLRREGGSQLLPGEYSSLEAAAHAVPGWDVVDIIDSGGFWVGMAYNGNGSVHIVLSSPGTSGAPPRVVKEPNWYAVEEALRERFPAEAANDTNPVETVLRLLERLWRWEH